MMDFQKERWIISCDDCDEVFDTECKNEKDALDAAYDQGWVKEGRFHYCQRCAESHEEEEEEYDES